jgi:hypothetical protein
MSDGPVPAAGPGAAGAAGVAVGPGAAAAVGPGPLACTAPRAGGWPAGSASEGTAPFGSTRLRVSATAGAPGRAGPAAK